MKKAAKIGLLALLAGGLVNSLWASDYGSADAFKSGTIVAFPAREDLKKALTPLGIEEVRGRIASSTASKGLNFQIDESVAATKVSPLRNPLDSSGRCMAVTCFQEKRHMRAQSIIWVPGCFV